MKKPAAKGRNRTAKRKIFTASSGPAVAEAGEWPQLFCAPLDIASSKNYWRNLMSIFPLHWQTDAPAVWSAPPFKLPKSGRNFAAESFEGCRNNTFQDPYPPPPAFLRGCFRPLKSGRPLQWSSVQCHQVIKFF